VLLIQLNSAVANSKQEDKNRAQGGQTGRQQPGQEQYNRSSQQSANASGYASGGYPGQSDSQAAADGGADPYAAYGGYQNYVNMWYAALGQQQQQQGGMGQPPGQPGAGPAPP
jgi:far upstream element-binding protein